MFTFSWWVLSVIMLSSSACMLDPFVIANYFLPPRWRHPLHPFLEEPRADWLMGASVAKRSPSLLLLPRHLSVHLSPRLPPATSTSLPVLTDSWACAHRLSVLRHALTDTHRSTPMRIPSYRTNTTFPRSSPSTTNLCFVKYTNVSINLDMM